MVKGVGRKGGSDDRKEEDEGRMGEMIAAAGGGRQHCWKKEDPNYWHSNIRKEDFFLLPTTSTLGNASFLSPYCKQG